MIPDRTATEKLAALIVATGIVGALPAVAAGSDGDATKVIDRTPQRIAMSGKDSVCGKCGANSCGMSFRDRMRQQQQQKRKQAHRRKRSSKSGNSSQNNKQAGR
jgi:hypothetical protein